ncbi:unnamed protein product, partial [Ixodes hexagonus]
WEGKAPASESTFSVPANVRWLPPPTGRTGSAKDRTLLSVALTRPAAELVDRRGSRSTGNSRLSAAAKHAAAGATTTTATTAGRGFDWGREDQHGAALRTYRYRRPVDMNRRSRTKSHCGSSRAARGPPTRTG